jgi:hypothetical protein
MKDDLGHAPITGVVILILKGADPGQPPVETPDKFAEGFSDARRNRGVCQRRDALPRIPDSTPTSAFTVSRRRRQPCRSSPIPRADRDYHLHAYPVFPDVLGSLPPVHTLFLGVAGGEPSCRSGSLLIAQQDVSVAEGPRPGQRQGQPLVEALEHGPAVTEDDGDHHDLVFVDQPLLRQL